MPQPRYAMGWNQRPSNSAKAPLEDPKASCPTCTASRAMAASGRRSRGEEGRIGFFKRRETAGRRGSIHIGSAPLALDGTASVSLDLRLVAANRQIEALGVLADPTRRRLFEQLARGPSPVGELAREMPVTRPAVSQHLKVLKGAGLVFDRQVGTRRLYQLDPRGVEALRDYLDSFWGQALAAFQAHVEQEEKQDG